MEEKPNKLKSWIVKKGEGDSKQNSQETLAADSAQNPPVSLPELSSGSGSRLDSTDKSEFIPIPHIDEKEWEVRQSALFKEQEEAQLKISQLAQEISKARQNFKEEIRKKEEDRIKLMAEFSLSESHAQSMLDQQREMFTKLKGEMETEITILEKRLAEEQGLWSKMMQEMEKTREEFLANSEFHLQEKELEKKRKEQELEKALGELENQITHRSYQIETEKKQWMEQMKALEEENISLRSQLQLKQLNRRLQDQKFEQDVAQNRSDWESKIHALEIQLEQERQKWLETLAVKDSELSSVKVDQDRKESAIRFALKKKEEEIVSIRMRAESKLRSLKEEGKRLSNQYESGLKNRREEIEKLRVEMMLLESQLKVDTERAENNILIIEKEANEKIDFLENKIQEELALGEKAIDAKKAEIQSLEMQFSIKRKQMDEEFNQKKIEMDKQKDDLDKQLHEMAQLIDEEKDHHAQELTKRDESIGTMKHGIALRMEEMRKNREQFAVQLEAKRVDMSQQISQLDENFKAEKQRLLDQMVEQGKLLSDKKAALAREQSLLSAALKKQEEDILFEIQPIRNQIQDMKNRLEQERFSREKMIKAKELIIDNLKKQKQTQEEAINNDLQQFEVKFKKEESVAREKLDQIQGRWDKEKVQLIESREKLEIEISNLAKEIEILPNKFETEREKLIEQQYTEKADLTNQYNALQFQIQQETEAFESKLKEFEDQQSDLNQWHHYLQEKYEKEKADTEAKLQDEKKQWEEKIIRTERDNHEEKLRFQEEIEASQKELESIQNELTTKRASYETIHNELEKKWYFERKEIEDQVSTLQKDYDSKKMIWQNALLERSSQIKDLEHQIESDKRYYQSALVELGQKRKTSEDEMQKTIADLEDKKASMRAESLKSLGQKENELSALESSLKEFIRQAEENQVQRAREISDLKAVLKTQLESLELQHSEETPRWNQELSERDSKISFLKSVIALKETDFKAAWEKEEKEFESYKAQTGEKIHDLQESILTEHKAMELEASDIDREIRVLRDQQMAESKRRDEATHQMEEEFANLKSGLEAEITECDRKITQERTRAEQQIKVKEIEIASLQKTLEQKEIQHSLAKESRLKEVGQERSRLLDWERVLTERLEKEKENTKKVLGTKQAEIDSLKEKILLENEQSQKKQFDREQEVLSQKANMEIHLRELSRSLEEESVLHDTNIKNKQQELEQLTSKLTLWNETLKLEEEQDQLRWEEERQRLERDIQDYEMKLSEERSELDLKMADRTDDITRLSDELTRLQQGHESRMNEFKMQQSDILQEEERFEKKIKDEKARFKEEGRLLDREIERLKVDIALRETRVSIEKQKREREVRWSRRPLEAKLVEIKRRWDEREKDKKRKMDSIDYEREKISVEIKRLEDANLKEIQERESAILAFRDQLGEKMSALREQFNQEVLPQSKVIANKQEELNLLKEALVKLDELVRDSQTKLESTDSNDLTAEILVWEQKLEAALAGDQQSLSEGKLTVTNKQKELTEKRSQLAKEKITTHDIVSKVKKESNKFLKAIDIIEENLDKKVEQSSRFRIYMESGIAAFEGENYQQAMTNFNQALEIDPLSAICYQMKGLTYEKLGNKELALESFRKVLELDPDNDFVREYIQRFSA